MLNIMLIQKTIQVIIALSDSCVLKKNFCSVIQNPTLLPPPDFGLAPLPVLPLPTLLY